MPTLKERRLMRRENKTGTLAQFRNARKYVIATVKSLSSNDTRALLAAVESGTLNPDDWKIYFKPVWSVVSSALSVVMLMTNDKTDAILEEIMEVGNAIAAGKTSAQVENKFMESFTAYWKYVKTALLITMNFTPDKVDKVLEAVVAYGDMLEDAFTPESE